MNTARRCRQVIKLICIVIVFAMPVLGAVPALASGGEPLSGPAAGFHLSGRFIHDARGTNFIMRGVNHPHTWFPGQTSSFAAIKAKGANTVRVVLSSGQVWDKTPAGSVANVISICKASRLACVLDVHDTTGYGQQPGAATLGEAVAYWKEIQSVLTGQEAYVIINIGNEPYGNTNVDDWVDDTKAAILEMRDAGFQHLLMVDAPGWGQDGQFVMRDHAASVLASDPHHNTVFSIHMFGVLSSADQVRDYLEYFVNADLPLVIGEFGHLHPAGDPPEDDILRLAEEYGIGYLGWSWSGNCCGVEYLDLVTNFDPNQMTQWGRRLFEGPNGIQQTACEASIFGRHCFQDVPVTYWAWNFVERLYRADITGGCVSFPRQYCPESTVTRAQMAVFLLRGIHGASYVPPATGPGTGFGDVPPTYWAAAWIKQLAAAGITGGCGSGNYCPEAPVTRAQMAVFLLRSKHGSSYTPPGIGASTGFSDVAPDYWAAAWIKQLVAEGIATGCMTASYCPESPVTRAQMAVFLVKTFNLP